MNTETLIYSDDRQFVERLRAVINGDACDQVLSLTLADLNLARLPLDRHHHVLVDLRGADAPTHLERLRVDREEARGRSACVVGIVQQGHATESTALADQVLDATLRESEIERNLAATLQGAGAPLVSRSTFDPPRVFQTERSQFVTSSPALFSLLETVEMAAGQNMSVLITGETGSGKTTLARMIHDLSDRRDEPFVAISCASFTNELIGSELFGHMRGAFTGAERDKTGKFEVAGRGTILLDEVDLLSLQQQANLLRVIETGEFEPVGSNETRVTNARTIVASNICLDSLVAEDRFRIDLYYRLDQVKFEMPPLRERREDIVPLATHFIEECCREEQIEVNYIDAEFIELIKNYAWPGNIRQLRNEVRRAVLFCRDGVLKPCLLSPATRVKRQRCDGCQDLSKNVAATERDVILDALSENNFNRAATARALGISRVTLYNKIRKHKIEISNVD